LDHYDYLYRLAELAQNNGESLVTFLDDLRPFLGSADAMNSESGEVIAEARDSIRIMTVHAAKGLEFPVVFVSNFDAGSLRGSGPYFFLDSQPVRITTTGLAVGMPVWGNCSLMRRKRKRRWWRRPNGCCM
jgi:ATP-dependent exoDNAse (exonuclease V) beta subunit